MKKIIFSIALIIILAGIGLCLPLKSITELRNDLAFKAVEARHYSIAKPLYWLGKKQNDPMATNNWIVLDYDEKRNTPDLEKEVYRANARAAEQGFRGLLETGLPAAYYNLALFDIRCSAKPRCYQRATSHFQEAMALGDPLAEAALVLVERNQIPDEDKDALLENLKQAADLKEPWSAYRYANKIEDDDPFGAQDYALIAAEAGIALAQDYLAGFDRADSEYWYMQAAQAHDNRSLLAAVSLARLWEERGDYKEARKWYKLATEPRGKFRRPIVIREDGLRWKSMQYYRLRNISSSALAAYELGIMHAEGIGGPKSIRKARKYMQMAAETGWSDSVERLKSYGGTLPKDPDDTGDERLD